jgi:hypothetical protein
MNTLLRSFGSDAVADAYVALRTALRQFWDYVTAMRLARNREGAAEPWEELQLAREAVRTALAKIERLVSDELASL